MNSKYIPLFLTFCFMFQCSILADAKNPSPVFLEDLNAPADPLFGRRKIETIKEVRFAYKKLPVYFNKIKRCLVTGPCTKQEKAQVIKDIKRTIVGLSITMGVLYGWRLAYTQLLTAKKEGKLEIDPSWWKAPWQWYTLRRKQTGKAIDQAEIAPKLLQKIQDDTLLDKLVLAVNSAQAALDKLETNQSIDRLNAALKRVEQLLDQADKNKTFESVITITHEIDDTLKQLKLFNGSTEPQQSSLVMIINDLREILTEYRESGINAQIPMLGGVRFGGSKKPLPTKEQQSKEQSQSSSYFRFLNWSVGDNNNNQNKEKDLSPEEQREQQEDVDEKNNNLKK